MPEGCLCHLNFLVIVFDFIECFTTIFLHAHSWLNWVDEDDDEEELKEKPEDARYIKIIHEAPAVWTKDLINFNLLPSLGLRTH